jgi:hypothetical protein
MQLFGDAQNPSNLFSDAMGAERLFFGQRRVSRRLRLAGLASALAGWLPRIARGLRTGYDVETFEQRIQRVVREEVDIVPYDPRWLQMFRSEKENP